MSKLQLSTFHFLLYTSYMSWSTKRKFGFFSLFLLFLALIVGAPIFLSIYERPTCEDGRMNQGERGVDCGGPCIRLCPADFSTPKILWAHSSRVVPGVYNVMAYGENPNQSVALSSIRYLFKLYDAEGILVAEKRGSGSIPPAGRFALFEGGIRTGERVPVRTTFEFIDDFEWIPARPLDEISIVSVDIDSDTSISRAEARVRNGYVNTTLRDLDAFFIVYDRNGNRLAFSKTRLDSFSPKTEETLTFTWPEPIDPSFVKTELLFSGSIR